MGLKNIKEKTGDVIISKKSRLRLAFSFVGSFPSPLLALKRLASSSGLSVGINQLNGFPLFRKYLIHPQLS